ncbi:MAG: hypothetical protein GOV00_00280 [Candidatus Altiarchaeota archaeon]|nr:hypothetical protein [Candidatus Altiarchaeota archaeon]
MNELLKEFMNFSYKNFLTFTLFFVMFHVSKRTLYGDVLSIPFTLAFIYIIAYLSSKNKKPILELIIDLLLFMILFSALITFILFLIFAIALGSVYVEYLIFLQILPALMLFKLLPFPWVYTEKHKHLLKSTWNMAPPSMWQVLAIISTILSLYLVTYLYVAPRYASFTLFFMLPGTLAIRKAITKGLHVYPSLSKAT